MNAKAPKVPAQMGQVSVVSMVYNATSCVRGPGYGSRCCRHFFRGFIREGAKEIAVEKGRPTRPPRRQLISPDRPFHRHY